MKTLSKIFSNLKHNDIFLISILFVCSMFFSFYKIGNQSFSLDEAFSIYITKDLETLTSMLWNHEANMWFYYLLLYVWKLFGVSEFSLRSLSAFLSVLSVIALYFLTKEIWGRNVAFLTGLFTSIHMYFVFRAQQIRSYSLLLLLVTLSSYFFIRMKKYPIQKLWYVIFSVLSFYTHMYAGFIILSHSIMLIIDTYWEQKNIMRSIFVFLKRYLSVYLAIALLSLPLFFAPSFHSHQLDWISIPSATSLLITLYMTYGDMLPLVGVYGLLTLSVVRILLKKDNLSTSLFLSLWVIVPLCFSFIYSLFVKPIFDPDYFLFLVPPLMMIAAFAVTHIKSKLLRIGSISLILFFSLLRLSFWYSESFDDKIPNIITNHQQDWRKAAHYIDTYSMNDDVIIFYGYYSRLPFTFYERKDTPIVEIATNNYSLGGGEKPSLPNIDLIQSFTYERVWFVVNDDSLQIFNGKDQYDQIVVALQNNYHLESQQEFNGITELLFERNHG